MAALLLKKEFELSSTKRAISLDDFCRFAAARETAIWAAGRGL